MASGGASGRRRFRDRPIRQKVLLLIALATITGLGFTVAAVSIYDLTTFRRRAVADATTLARVVGANALAALMFNDTSAAQADLASLSQRDEVGTVAIYRADGAEFARFTRPGGPAPLAAPPDSAAASIEGDRLVLVRPLESEGEVVGWLRLQYLLPTPLERLPAYGIIGIVVLAALAVAAGLLLTTLERSVTGPLNQLAEAAGRLAVSEDLAIRARKRADDEIGAVTDAFNRMLDTLQERATALRKQAGELDESETRLRLALAAATMQPWSLPLITGSDGRRRADPEHLRALLDPIHPEDRAAVDRAIADTLLHDRALEIEFRSGSVGAERWQALRGHLSPAEDGRPPQLIGLMQDVTHRRKLEEQLLQAQKMEAIGNLAGGIAHDFNNLLTGMIGHLKFVQRALPPGSEPRADLDEVEHAARRAAALTAQLLAYARRQMVTPSVVDVNAAIEAVEPMLRRVLGETVEVSLRLEPDLAAVKVDAGQLDQVLVNLAVNARDAMPGGGRLTIATTARPADDPDFGGTEEAWVEIAVSDVGTGIAADALPHIFEPFFTTKPVGQGTGLGLAMCYGIVKQAEGHILVESTVGKGTTVRVRLPALPGGTPSAHPANDPDIEGAIGNERVLLVEDDDAIRDLAARSLREAGYQVLAAADGGSARALAAEDEMGFDVLVTDVVMPQLNGRDLAAALRARRPTLPIVFMSGYSATVDDEADPFGTFLAKPFTPDGLCRAVRRVMDRAPAQTER
ncbi:MAG TPA: ATP-binding protein [Gemmatimonadales bacterium]|nr:ATP-binding protein [Gemmatimonadales bacterium]